MTLLLTHKTGDLTAHFSASEWTSESDPVPYPVDQVDDEDPEGRPWRVTRLLPLAETAEIIRFEANRVTRQDGTLALTDNGGYRTKGHQQAIVDHHGADDGTVASPDGSQHPKGRAADVRHSILSATQLHALILHLWLDGKLPHLGGLGLYPTFVHIDVRPRPAGSTHLARWGGERLTNDVPHQLVAATAEV